MKALRFRVQNFRNVEDSGWIELDQVTAFVGRNESGKTALLKALHKFNPASDEPYNPQKEFPRDRYTRDYVSRKNQAGKWPVCSVEFEIPETIKTTLVADGRTSDHLPEKVIATRHYDGTLNFEYEPTIPDQTVSPGSVIEALNAFASEARRLPALEGENEEQATTRRSDLIEWTRDWGSQLEEFEDLRAETRKELLEQLQGELEGKSSPTTADMAETLLKAVEPIIKESGKPPIAEEFNRLLEEALPVMIYFENYGILDSAIWLPRFVEDLARDKDNPRVRTINAMFDLVSLDAKEIEELGDKNVRTARSQGHEPTPEQIEAGRQNIEERAIRLNSASIDISNRFSNWWSQRRHTIRYDVDGEYFRIWVSDNLRPDVVIELESRSKGFQWFFSFYLVFLAESDQGHKDAMLLLDEPGLNLHPTAQQELLDFFEELSQTNQLAYTTHSPFLIDGEHLDRVRPVSEEDTGHSRVTSHWWPSDRDTIFPLQAAAGYAMIQSLLQHQKNLLVEGMSDFYYLQALSAQCARTGRQGLPDEIYITPCGGASKVGHLASLFLGQKARPVVVLDTDQAGRNRKNSLMKELYAGYDSSIIMLDEVIGRPGDEIEIEDIIGEEIVIEGVSRILGAPFELSDQNQSLGGVVNRIQATAEKQGVDLGEAWKARASLELVGTWAENKTTLPAELLDTAEKLFRSINKAFYGPEESPRRSTR